MNPPKTIFQVILFLAIASGSAMSQSLSQAQTAGGCSGYHLFWSRISSISSSPNDARFSDIIVQNLDSQFQSDSSYLDTKVKAFGGSVNAYQSNNTSLVKSFAGLCVELGLPVGQNTGR